MATYYVEGIGNVRVGKVHRNDEKPKPLHVYKVEVTEVLSKTVEIIAESEEDAIWYAENSYYDEKIVLDYSDFAYADFNIAD